jgi:hypothetical protein
MPIFEFACRKCGNEFETLVRMSTGKTTVAARLAQEHGAILISEDTWLMRLFGDQMKTLDDYIRFSQQLKTVVGQLVVDLRPEGSHHLTEEDLVHVSSFLQAPEEAESFNVKVHAA